MCRVHSPLYSQGQKHLSRYPSIRALLSPQLLTHTNKSGLTPPKSQQVPSPRCEISITRPLSTERGLIAIITTLIPTARIQMIGTIPIQALALGPPPPILIPTLTLEPAVPHTRTITMDTGTNTTNGTANIMVESVS